MEGHTHTDELAGRQAGRQTAWGLSSYQARRDMSDSRGPVLVAGLSLNIKQETVDQLSNPNVLCVACLNLC
jgi:hypothetical protein